MAATNASKIVLPVEVAQDILRKAQNNSTIQVLSPSNPVLFKNVENAVFTKEPEAESSCF